MSILLSDIGAISDLALEVTAAILAKNEETKKIESEEAGPLAVASALSDFFKMAPALDAGTLKLEDDELAEFADFGLYQLDRLAYQLLVLEVMEHRENMGRIFASLGLWFARHDVSLNNLEGIADGFGRITNGLSETEDLANMCKLMDDVASAASHEVQMDEDRSNPTRPWRVINLNMGIAATRSLDSELMAQTFDNLGRRLPDDMPGFLADGKRQMAVQNVPDDVVETMNRYVAKWPTAAPH